MKKILKKEVIISFIIGVILASSIAVYATMNASEVDYKNGQKVSQALDDLYSKIPSGSLDITSNGNNINVKQYEKVNVNVTVAGTKTLLWTNDSPTSNIEATNITLSNSLSNYSHILVQYKVKTNSTDIYEDLFKIIPNRPSTNFSDKGQYMIGASNTNSEMIARPIRYVDSTTLRIGNATNFQGTIEANYLIPTTIYGLNFSY